MELISLFNIMEKHRRPNSSGKTRNQKLIYNDIRPATYEQFFPPKLVVTPTRSFVPPNFFFPQASMKKEPEYNVVFNVAGTKYRIVKEVGEEILNFVLTTNPHDEWDVAWIDCYQDFSDFSKLKSYQKINFFPGIGCLARKDHLSRNLIRLKKMFPEDYDFFPDSYVMPMDYETFKSQFPKTGKQPTFIVKPQASSQGRGIFLTQTWKNVPNSHRYVVQRYITNPYLLDELKFDLRIYVLVTSVDPLKIYLFKDGLARFATEKYKDAGPDNITNMFMHLTNYAINKNSSNFVFNIDEKDSSTGHKRSIKALFKTLQERGRDTKKLWIDIKKIVIKTFCSVQATLSQNYKSTFPKKAGNRAAFQVFGFDVMIDENFKPWLLEVNSSPSLSSDTPLDRTIKEKVIGDALRIAGVNSADRVNLKMKQQARELEKRIERLYKIPKHEQEIDLNCEFLVNDFDEAQVVKNSGYEMIYPPKENAKHNEDYNVFMKEIKMFRSSSIEMSDKRNNEAKNQEKSRPRSSSNSNSYLANSKIRKSSSRQDLIEGKTSASKPNVIAVATKERPKSSMSNYNSYKKVLASASPSKKLLEEQPNQSIELEERPKIILTRYEMPQKVMLNSPTGGAVKTKVISAAVQKSFDESGSKVQRYSVQTKTPGIQTVSIVTDKIVKKFNKAAAQKVYSKDSKEATTEASSNDSFIEKKKVVNKSLTDFKAHQTPDKKRYSAKKLSAKKNAYHKSSSDLLEKSVDSKEVSNEASTVNAPYGLVEKYRKFTNTSMKRNEEGAAYSHAGSASKGSPRGTDKSQKYTSVSMKNPPTETSFYRVNTDDSSHRRDAGEDIKSSLPKRFAQFLSKIDSEDRRLSAQNFHVMNHGIFAAKNSIDHDRSPVKTPTNNKPPMKTKAIYYEKIPTELTPTRNSITQKAQPKLTNFIMPGLFDGSKGGDRSVQLPSGMNISQNSGFGMKVITKGKSLMLNAQE